MAGPPVRQNGTSVAGATAASVVITLPSGIGANDVIIVSIYKENTNAVTPPAGYTEKPATGPSTTAPQMQHTFWHRASGSETGTITFSWTGSVFCAATCDRITGCVTSGDPVEGTPATNSSNTSVTTLNVSLGSTSANTLLYWAGTDFTGGNTWTVPSGFGNLVDLDILARADKANAAGGATGNVTGTANISGPMTAVLLDLLPDTGTPAPPALIPPGLASPMALGLHFPPQPPPPAPVVTAAGPVSRPQPVTNRPPAPHRARAGRFGALAAGILAVTTLSPQPSSVPPARPQPVIGHPAPHRALARGVLVPPQLPVLTAKLPPTAVSPRPPHRALVRGILAKTSLSPQPSSVPPPQWRQPNAPRPPHRAIWRAAAGPAPASAAVTAVPPARPAPVTNRPPPPHRAIAKGILAATTLAAQPSRVPPPQWRQPNAPRPPHRATWRVIAGPAPAVIAPAPAAPARPAPTTNRPPAPHRAIIRRILAPPAPPVPPARPAPVINRPPAPHRALARGVLARTTLAAQPSRVSGPQWRQPFAPRPAHRAIWRRIAAPAPPPPPFTIGQLTAASTSAALTATGASSTLTASGTGLGTLTATDQRKGGPG